MFASAMHQTPDTIRQHCLQPRVGSAIDAGGIRTAEVLKPINAAITRRAHAMRETHLACGDIVMEGF